VNFEEVTFVFVVVHSGDSDCDFVALVKCLLEARKCT
jgi:hypothetical protein